MGLLDKIKSGVAKVLDTATIALAHPIKTATAVVSSKSTLEEVRTAHFKQPLATQIKQTILGTAGIAAAVVGTGAAVTAARAGTLAKAIIPTTLKGKAAAALVVPVAATAVINKPSLIVEAPSKILNFQTNVGEFIAQPSTEKAKDIISENPIISGGIAAAVLGGAALKVLPAIATARQTEAIQEQTEAIKGVSSTPQPSVMYPNQYNAAAPTPQTAQTKQVSDKPLTKRKKRSVKARMPSINQRVNVIVQNKQDNRTIKKYLNRQLLIN